MIGDSADQHISFPDQKPLYIKLGEVHTFYGPIPCGC